jgi:hypothetical protein
LVVGYRLSGEYSLPIILHADHRPAALVRLGQERVDERADLAGGAVMREHHQARAVAGRVQMERRKQSWQKEIFQLSCSPLAAFEMSVALWFCL